MDSNLLVYAARAELPLHAAAAAAVNRLAAGAEAWAIPWPCVHEFLAVVTNPRIFRRATAMDRACEVVEAWRSSPRLQFLGEEPGYWEQLRERLREGRAVGPLTHDARVAALCLLHGVRELWTADRDFSRFPSLPCRNPLVGAPPS